MKTLIQFFIILIAFSARAQIICVDYNTHIPVGYSTRVDLDRDGSFDVKFITAYDNTYGNAYVIYSLKPETGNYQYGNIRFRENSAGFARNYSDGTDIPRGLGTTESYDTLSKITYEASHGYMEFDEDDYPTGNIIYRKELGYTIDYSFGIPETLYSWCSGWIRIELLNGLDSIRIENSCGCLNEGMNAGQPVYTGCPPLDTAIITNGNDLSVRNYTGADYQWYRNGDAITGATSRFYTATGSGSFYAIITVGNCTYQSSSHSITGIISINNFTHIIIFPNPNAGSFTVQLETAMEKEIQVSVVNILGQEIFKTASEKLIGEYSKQIELENADAGVYFVRLRVDKEFANQKIIVH